MNIGYTPMYKRNQFALKTQIPTFLYTIESNGTVLFGDRQFGLPLFNFQDRIMYDMNLNSNIFIPQPDGIIIMDDNPAINRFQFGKIEL